ncbi:MAG: branched-chain amino acid aminotransferase [Helicobacteraceae bacterium CG2_30_36_10]|nr:MAG: branched-chain amino acid aminotransferase [Helicobacteraceae bacterium CG2_30_36_10]
MPYHQKRYAAVLESLGAENVQNLEDYLNAPAEGLYRCRLVYTPSEITVTYHEYKKRDISTLKLIFNNDIEYSEKSTYRDEIDTLFSQRDDADDILIIKNLLVCDTSIANIALYRSGMWITPKTPLLKGTTRARLIEEAKIIEADIKVSELRTFSQVALLNAMIDFDVLDKCEFLL